MENSVADIVMINQSSKEKRIRAINKIGLLTLIRREVLRFVSVYTQTIIAPMVTTLIFYTVFALAFGGAQRTVHGVSFMEFLLPGLIMMTMVQNAFANASSSLVISKVQGNIVDILMPPLSAMEIFIGYAAGAVIRGLIVGVFTSAMLALFAPIHFHSLLIVSVFAFLGVLMLASLGIAAGIWSDRFDHIAAVTNFVVMPMTFLSGTFYSIDILPDFWQSFAYLNPFFYMIDGFRYGFIGQSDSNINSGLLILLSCNLVLISISYLMIKTGYKIKS